MTEIKKIGEFGLIDRMSAISGALRRPETLLGIGDDAAVIDLGRGEVVLLAADMLIEGTHFDLTYAPLKHLGYKAVAVNVSDIAAMNALPTHITVSIGLSSRFTVEAIEELYRGIAAACEAYNIDLAGGDTTSSHIGLVISISVYGRGQKDKLAYRRGAKPGDVLCVSGDLGGAYAGLQVLKREKAEFQANPDMQPRLDDYVYVVDRQLKPEGRTDIVHSLAEAGVVPTSMIDISDGLASELMHICTQSGTGAVVFEENIPYEGATQAALIEFNLQPITAAMNGGEDYELLFSVSAEDYKKIENHIDITAIGYITEKDRGLMLRSSNGNHTPLQAMGWTHF